MKALVLRSARALGILAAASALNGQAWAKPLISVWTLEPLSAVGPMDIRIGEPFLEQRLLPHRLVRLSESASLPNGKALAKGTYLFVVYQADGQSAYCTIKDQSAANVAKSLFIPALDKRPCLIDRDGDQRFDATFGVFDKYGSALTPSGNMSSAKNLAVSASYDKVDAHEFPVNRKFSYALSNTKSASNSRISVSYDNGSGYEPWNNHAPGLELNEERALNLLVKIDAISDGHARITAALDPDIYLIGVSGGTFSAGSLPDFAK